MTSIHVRRALTGGMLVLIAAVHGGCGNKGLVKDFRVPPEQRAALTSAQISGHTLRLPADAPFNITDKSSSQIPGMGGTARGESAATGQGTAFCRLEAANAGGGEAQFQLGHCLDNRSDSAVQAEATFTCEYAVNAQLTDGNEGRTTGTYAMELYVNDSDGRVLGRIPIETSGTDESIGGTAQFIKTIGVRLEPERVYNFVVAGMVSAQTNAGGNAELGIEIKTLQLTVTTTAAPQES